MTTRHNANTPELPQTIRADKLRYGVFGSDGRHEVWIMRGSNLEWTMIARFDTRQQARDAVDRYLYARALAKDLACRF